MALKSSVIKCKVDLSDCNRHVYEPLKFTIAQHPSETSERLASKVLSYLLFYHQDMRFTKGLCEADEPELWIEDQQFWIELGEPKPDRLLKLSKRAHTLILVTHLRKSEQWFNGLETRFHQMDKFSVIYFDHEIIEKLSANIDRVIDWAVTISDRNIMISVGEELFELPVKALQDNLRDII